MLQWSSPNPIQIMFISWILILKKGFSYFTIYLALIQTNKKIIDYNLSLTFCILMIKLPQIWPLWDPSRYFQGKGFSSAVQHLSGKYAILSSIPSMPHQKMFPIFTVVSNILAIRSHHLWTFSYFFSVLVNTSFKLNSSSTTSLSLQLEFHFVSVLSTEQWQSQLE